MHNFKAYIIPIEDIDISGVLKTWLWLTGENKKVIALTKLGDILLNDGSGKLYLLDTGKGKMEMVAISLLAVP